MKILRNPHIKNNHTRAALSFNTHITTKLCTRQTLHITCEFSKGSLLFVTSHLYSKGKTNIVSIALNVIELLKTSLQKQPQKNQNKQKNTLKTSTKANEKPIHKLSKERKDFIRSPPG